MFSDFISVNELLALRQRDDIVLLDVRDEASFQARHFADAVCMPPEILVNRLSELNDEKHYIMICYHGIMAVSVVNYLRQHGFSATTLKGGMAAVTDEQLAKPNK